MSVINKMLNDLDERSSAEQAQQEVAFLTPVAKPKRKWLVILLSSTVLGLAAIWGSYYFYDDLLALAGVKTAKPQFLTAEQMQARIDADEAAKAAATQTTSSSAEMASQQLDDTSTAQVANETPELIILKPQQNVEQPRPSTLKVIAPEGNVSSGDVVTKTEPEKTEAGQNELSSAQNVVDDISAQVALQNANTETSLTDEPVQAPDNTAEPVKKTKMQVDKVQRSPKQRAEKALHQAKELSKGGMIVEAIDKYREVLRFEPANQQGRSALAALYYGRNMTLEALSVLDEGLELDPANLGWSLLAAKIHYKRTNYAAALAYLQLPVQTFDHIEYVALKATTAYKLKAYDEAQDAYLKLTVADPSNGRWWLGLGTTYEAKGDQPSAIRAYRKSLRLANISTSSRQFVMSRLQRLAN